MPLANVNLTDTFQTWVTRTNQIINYTDQVNTQLQVISATANALPSNVRWTANAVNSIFFGSQALVNTSLVGANNILFKYNPNTTSLGFTTRRGNNVIFMQQHDDNFVMYTTNSAFITNKPVWSIWANTNNSGLRVSVPLQPEGGIKASSLQGFGSETFGNTGDILVSGGGGSTGSLIHQPSGTHGSYVTWQPQQAISVKAFGAVGNGTNNDITAIQSAINAANTNGSNVYFPAGIYSIDAPIDMRNRFVRLVGDGPTRSIIRSSQAMHTMIDVNQPSLLSTNNYAQLDNVETPFSIEGIGLDGNDYRANNGIAISLRQNFLLKNLGIRSCNNGITEASTSLGHHENIHITDCGRTGLNLGDPSLAYRSAVTFAESNTYAPIKSSIFLGTKITGNTPLGIAVFNSDGLKFQGLDITNLNPVSATPYAANLFNSINFSVPLGTGIYCAYAGFSVENSNLGANCSGPVIFQADGLVTLDKCSMKFGFTPNNNIYHSFYGTTKIYNSFIDRNLSSNNNLSTIRYIAKRDSGASIGIMGGKVSFHGCRINANSRHSNGSNHVMVGDVIDRGPPVPNYVPRHGRMYNISVVAGSGSVTQSVGFVSETFNRKTFTVTTGGITAASISAPLTLASANVVHMAKGENMGLIVVYSSTMDLKARFTETIGGTTGRFMPPLEPVAGLQNLFWLPSTNGVLSTLVRTNIQAFSTHTDDFTLFKFFEFVADNPPVGSAVTIQEVFLVDNRFLNAGQAFPGNPGFGDDYHYLYKP